MHLAETPSSGSNYSLFLVVGLLFVVMYFFMIRPQQRRRREVEALQSALNAGDEVVTVGGLYGTVRSFEDDSVLLEIAPGVSARYARGAISRVINRAESVDEADDPTADKVIDTD